MLGEGEKRRGRRVFVMKVAGLECCRDPPSTRRRIMGGERSLPQKKMEEKVYEKPDLGIWETCGSKKEVLRLKRKKWA